MVHGIYIRTRPKNKWHLVSITLTPEAAKSGSESALESSKAQGNIEAESIIQTFESSFYIPETLSSTKDQKLMYN